MSGDVVRVELAGDCDIAVAVEAFHEFLTLVAEIRLCGEVGGRPLRGGGIRTVRSRGGRRSEGRGSAELWICVLHFRLRSLRVIDSRRVRCT